MSQLSPFGSSAAVAGCSPDIFLVTQAMCQPSAITSGLPRGTALPATRNLPVELRMVRALASCTVVFQSRSGATWTRTMAAGDTEFGFIVALSGLASDTALLGYV